MRSLTGFDTVMKVAFGTEGGLFAAGVGAPTVICGPGSMDQGHMPDEYLETEQISHCEQMMFRLVERLEAGV